MRRVAPALVLALLVSLYAAVVGPETVRQHQKLETRAYDMGALENVFWNSVHGRPFENAFAGGSHLGLHASFIYAVLFPVYAAIPKTETLLWAQTLLLALAAVPLFLLARRRLGDGIALVLGALWLWHPALAGANFYDFHELAFAPVLFFAAALALDARRPGLLALACVLLVSVKEDQTLLVAGLGLYALLSGRRREGIALVAGGAASFFLLTRVVIPHFAGGPSSYDWYYDELLPGGGSATDLAIAVLSHPGRALLIALKPAKLLYVAQLLGPLAFLPLLSPGALALVAAPLGLALLATRPYLTQIGFHYALAVLAPAFAGAVVVLGRVREEGRPHLVRAALAASVVLSLAAGWAWGLAGPRRHVAGGFRVVAFGLTNEEFARYAEVREVAASLPEDAFVAASETLVPHVARRRRVATVRYPASAIGADYLWLLGGDVGLVGPGGPFEGYAFVRPGRDTLLLKRRDLWEADRAKAAVAPPAR